MNGNNNTTLTRSKSKRSEHEKVKKLKKAINRRFNSKSYESISLSKKNKEDMKKNIITFIHSNGLIQSDMKNKTHYTNTNNVLKKSDSKKKEGNANTAITSEEKENLRSRRFSLPSPEILKELQNHRNKVVSPRSLVSSKQDTHAIKKDPLATTITITTPSKSKSTKKHSSASTKTKTHQNVTIITTNSTTTKKAKTTNATTKKSTNSNPTTKNSKPYVTKMTTSKSPKPKSKLFNVITLPASPTIQNDSPKPSAPSINEMYLEEVKDHQNYLLYNEEQSSRDIGKSLPTSIPSPHLHSIDAPIQNPFKPPFTTLSSGMTMAVSTTSIPITTVGRSYSEPVRKSPFNDALKKLPKPTSLSFYTHTSSSLDTTTVPPKIGTDQINDHSIEKVIPNYDLVSRRRDSLDFYFDKLSQPSRTSSFASSFSINTNSPLSSIYLNSGEIDIPSSLEITQQRMMSEPQPTCNVGHSDFNQVMKETSAIRTKLEDKVEETKFQMMIAITQLKLINEQLDILNFN